MTSRVPALQTAVMGSKKAIEDTISIAGAGNNALHKTYPQVLVFIYLCLISTL